jgi:hypothetical protein
MSHTRLTARKSTGRWSTSQLVPQNVPPLQEPRPDSPPHTSQEEEPFEIELVVLGCFTHPSYLILVESQDSSMPAHTEGHEENLPTETQIRSLRMSGPLDGAPGVPTCHTPF